MPPQWNSKMSPLAASYITSIPMVSSCNGPCVCPMYRRKEMRRLTTMTHN